VKSNHTGGTGIVPSRQDIIRRLHEVWRTSVPHMDHACYSKHWEFQHLGPIPVRTDGREAAIAVTAQPPFLAIAANIQFGLAVDAHVGGRSSLWVDQDEVVTPAFTILALQVVRPFLSADDAVVRGRRGPSAKIPVDFARALDHPLAVH
jgi:hypothetical protein